MNKVGLLFILLVMSSVTNSAAQTDDAWLLIKPQECRFSGEFTQKKLLQGLDHALVSSGVFFYDCGLGIIWKTLTPIVESLVLNKTGDSHIVKRLKIEVIQSQQNKFISQLIMALVSADEAYLSSTFDSSRVNSNTVVLTPTNRRLKRAIKSITLSENTVSEITFDMLDQNLQTTSIISTVLINYPENSSLETKKHCIKVSELTDTECNLLKAETD